MNAPDTGKATARPWLLDDDAGRSILTIAENGQSSIELTRTSASLPLDIEIARANAALIVAAVNQFEAHNNCVVVLRFALERLNAANSARTARQGEFMVSDLESALTQLDEAKGG